MSEPKRYKLDELYNQTMLGMEVFFRGDDPAVTSALKDSEDLQTIKHLVGAHSVDEIKQWKRNSDKLAELKKPVGYHDVDKYYQDESVDSRPESEHTGVADMERFQKSLEASRISDEEIEKAAAESDPEESRKWAFKAGVSWLRERLNV